MLLDGTDIYEPKRLPADVRRRIGMVFQKPNPFPAMSIYDNVASGLKLAGIRASNKDEVVETSLTRAGLWNEVHDRLRAPGGALSGGQQQRLCIARSLAVSPDVLLMDEPCSALDPTSTRRVEETITELRGQVTIVIVTHNMQQAARVSDRCAFFLATQTRPATSSRTARRVRCSRRRRPAHRRLRQRPLRLTRPIRHKSTSASPRSSTTIPVRSHPTGGQARRRGKQGDGV